MNEHRDTDLSALLSAASETYRPDPDLRARVDRRAAQQQRRARAAMTMAVLLIVAVAASSLVYRGRQGGDVTTDFGAPGSSTPATAAPSSSVTPTAAAIPPHAVDWKTDFVAFHADDYAIDVEGQHFVGDDQAVTVRSDPGMANQYTTLEVTWHENGVEMRMDIYFTSDGEEWWSNEIRTYDGRPRGNWITYKGDFFRRPLGHAFTGDLNLPADAASQDRDGRFTLRGLRVQAFLPPTVCANQTTPFTLEMLYPDIKMTNEPTTGFSANVRLRDAQCQPVGDLTPFTFEYTVDDPQIVFLFGGCSAIDPGPTCKGRAELKGLRAGNTTVRLTVRNAADKTPVAAGTMTVTVTDSH